MQLRYLQTLTEIASERNSTLIFPLPIDLLKPFFDVARSAGGGGNAPASIPSESGGS